VTIGPANDGRGRDMYLISELEGSSHPRSMSGGPPSRAFPRLEGRAAVYRAAGGPRAKSEGNWLECGGAAGHHGGGGGGRGGGMRYRAGGRGSPAAGARSGAQRGA